MKTKITPPFAALGMLCAIIMPSQAAVIVTENFAGTGQLKSASVDFISPDIVTAGGTAAWHSHDQFWKDGAVIKTTTGTQNRNAVLRLGSYINDAKGTSDGLFVLTATIGPMTGGSFLSVGFSNVTTSGGIVTFAGRGGLGTMAYRTNGDIDQWAGSGDTNEVAADDTLFTGARTLTIALDLRNHDGTTNFGSVSFSDSVAGTFGSFDYTEENNFNSIMLSTANSIGPAGTYSNLTLTQIPEPSAALLGGLGLLALLRRRR